jgi:hypothetical protein
MAQRPLLINDKTMPCYTAIVTIAADTLDNAEQVLNERIYYDEDYGFPYEVTYSELQPEKSTRGIIIDASVIRDKLDSFMKMHSIDGNDPFDKPMVDAYNRIKSMNKGDLNALISSIDDKYVWELFNDLCDQVIDSVIDTVMKTNPS